MVPDYDRITKPTEIPKNVVSFHHGDVEVLSRVMKLRVSYKWRPILNDTVIETLRYWSIQNESVPPDFIVLSNYSYALNIYSNLTQSNLTIASTLPLIW